MDLDPPELLALADWRRRVSDMYREVREEPDPRRAWDRWRSLRDGLFRNHPQSPVPPEDRDGFAGLSYFDYDPAARVVATVEPVEPSTWSIEVNEGTLTLDCVLKASFELFGETRSLKLYWFRSYGGGLFVSYRDATSGLLTYGGCRYLLDTVKGADLGTQDGGLVLDFNFSYQPSCSYDSRWVCPLAPPANRLDVGVKAGERLQEPAAVE